MFEIGNSLREARVRRGIDFAQVEVATKIRGKYLRALEDEQFDVLPAETYVKGFLRTYAEYLGLDGQLYVDEFNSRFVTGDEREPRPRPSKAQRGHSQQERRNGGPGGVQQREAAVVGDGDRRRHHHDGEDADADGQPRSRVRPAIASCRECHQPREESYGR